MEFYYSMRGKKKRKASSTSCITGMAFCRNQERYLSPLHTDGLSPPTNTRYITKNTKQIIPSIPSERPSSQIPSSSFPVGQSERLATFLCAVESLTRGVIGDLTWGKVYISIYPHSDGRGTGDLIWHGKTSISTSWEILRRKTVQRLKQLAMLLQLRPFATH